MDSAGKQQNVDFYAAGLTASSEGRHTDAIACFERVLRDAPDDPRVLFALGNTAAAIGHAGAAENFFRRVLAHDPAHHRARMNLGYCLIELGQLDDGIACLRAAVEAAPHNYGNALRMLISAGRGRFWLKRSAAAECLGLNGEP